MNVPPTTTEKAWEGGPVLQPSSHFSKEIFKTIRPSIPRQAWPDGTITGIFMPLPSGNGLIAEFEDFSAPYEKRATELVLARGAEFVLISPAKGPAIRVYRTKSFRDVFLYSLIPLLFAIPMVDAVLPEQSQLLWLPLIADAIALIGAHVRLTQLRTTLQNSRFLAKIPTPTFRISQIS